jgi:hypothetical protein
LPRQASSEDGADDLAVHVGQAEVTAGVVVRQPLVVLKELVGLQQLQSLRLRATRVTNDGLKELKALKQLK